MVLGPGAQKILWVIKSTPRIPFKVLSRTSKYFAKTSVLKVINLSKIYLLTKKN